MQSAAAGGGLAKSRFQVFRRLGVNDDELRVATLQHDTEVGTFHFTGQNDDFFQHGGRG